MPIFIYKDNIIEYTLTRNAKKNVNFRIKPTGEVCISTPRRVNKIELEKMIYDKADWIIQNRNKVSTKKQNLLNKNIQTGSEIFVNGMNT